MLILFRSNGKRNESVTGPDNFAMDFITYNKDIVLSAYFSDFGKFFFAPYSTCRVMRIAEQKNLCFFIAALFFKIFKIDGIMSDSIIYSIFQWTFGNFASVVSYGSSYRQESE